MLSKLSLALSAVLAAFLFAGAATAAPANGNTIHQFAPNTNLSSGMIKKPKIKMPNVNKIKNKKKFKYTKKNKGVKTLIPSTGGSNYPPHSPVGGGSTNTPAHVCDFFPSKCGGGSSGGNNGNNGHKHHGHSHGFPGLQVGLGFGYNVTEVAPAVPYAAYPVACVVPPAAAAQPTLLDQVVARLVQLDELNRRDLIEDDEYEIQKTVVLLTLVPVTVAQEVGVAYALQVLKCIEAQDLISSNEYDAKRKEFVAIL